MRAKAYGTIHPRLQESGFMFASVRRPVAALCTTFALCAAGAVTPVAAQAQTIPTCPAAAISQPFAPWGDQSNYMLLSGGDFENLTWTLGGGAQQVAGSEPFAATGTLGAHSVSLPAGGSAASPLMCIDSTDLTLRFFVGGTGNVLVTVVYRGRDIPIGDAGADGAWTPSPVIFTGAPLLAPLGGGTAQVSFKFTALNGDPQIDDVFLDPWNRG
jgi:hypothetical protein